MEAVVFNREQQNPCSFNYPGMDESQKLRTAIQLLIVRRSNSKNKTAQRRRGKAGEYINNIINLFFIKSSLAGLCPESMKIQTKKNRPRFSPLSLIPKPSSIVFMTRKPF